MSETIVPLAADFEPPSREAWLELVEKVLKGADFEKRLVARTADGLAIQPLYTRTDAIAGAHAHRRARPYFPGGWDIRQRHAETDAEGRQRRHPRRPHGRRHVAPPADHGARPGRPLLQRRGPVDGAQGRVPRCLRHRARRAREHHGCGRQPDRDLARGQTSTRTCAAAPSTTIPSACWPAPARSTTRRSAPARSPPSSPTTAAP